MAKKAAVKKKPSKNGKPTKRKLKSKMTAAQRKRLAAIPKSTLAELLSDLSQARSYLAAGESPWHLAEAIKEAGFHKPNAPHEYTEYCRITEEQWDEARTNISDIEEVLGHLQEVFAEEYDPAMYRK